MKVTKRQKEILEFISGFIERNGYSPSMEEIAGYFSFASLNTVFKHLKALSDRGLLHRDSNRARSIQLYSETPVGTQDLPLLGYVAAGQPIEAISGTDTLPVPDYFLSRRSACYVLRVRGNSMIDEHIKDGDFVVVESRTTASSGKTVVALIDNENVTLKKYYPEGDRIRLQPANEEMAPIVVAADQVKIQGIVISVMRRYE